MSTKKISKTNQPEKMLLPRQKLGVSDNFAVGSKTPHRRLSQHQYSSADRSQRSSGTGVIKQILIFLGFCILVYLTFYYLFLTRFPIGDDPGHHISRAMEFISRNFSVNYLFTDLYQLPIAIFAIFKVLTDVNWPALFVFTICFFFFLLCIGLFFYTYKTNKNWISAISSAIILASSKWLFDSLRTGLLGEIWGLFIFILAGYFFCKENYWFAVLITLVLAISHPLVFVVFILIAFSYSLTFLLYRDKKQLVFALKYWATIAVMGLIIYFLAPTKMHLIAETVNNSTLAGARTLKVIMSEDAAGKLIIYLFSAIGLILNLKNLKNNLIRFMLITLIVSVFLTQSYIWGANFMVFRLYPYFELSAAFFAGLAIGQLLNYVFYKQNWIHPILQFLILIPLLFVLIFPNFKLNREITNWQLSDVSAKAILPEQDKETLAWAKKYLPEDSVFTATVKWGAWVKPLAGFQTIESEYYVNVSAEKAHREIQKRGITYIFKSQISDYPQISNSPEYFQLIYKNENSEIYQVK